ncbi:MAG TPA: glycine cleavage system aminomethyltransferase GcvT [Candidatus Kapabacteria bacterium]|nr:glycine cleavage system aminomethyltransferase GcvT [Candidatus Kapabacteria bacterium]
MKTTRFNAIHKKLNAKIVEFAGFEMPIQYPSGIIAEHNIVRTKVGVFDVSHMGEFFVKGSDALKFVQKITTNDASKLTVGAVQYSAMCFNDGGIVDDLLVYNLAENEYMLVVNGANIDKDWDWCQQNLIDFDVELNNLSDDYNLLAIQGPSSRAVLEKLCNTDISESILPFYHFTYGKIADVDMIISRTGYTGELGFEIYFKGDVELAENIWNKLFDAGAEFGIEAVGLGCRDTLRLEKAYCLYGNDIDQTTNVIEAGLAWITKLNKGDFNGSDVIKKVKEEKPSRKLVGIMPEADKFIARHGYKIFAGETEIGVITSGNLSPTLNKPIALGYVAVSHSAIDSKIEIEARGKRFPANVVKTPFVS